MQEQRSAGDGLAMMVRIGQAYEQIPPIEYQGHRARHQPTAFDVSCRKAGPTPVVFKFIKCVLTICAIAVELAYRQDLRAKRSHQNRIFPHFTATIDFSKAERQLACRIAFDE